MKFNQSKKVRFFAVFLFTAILALGGITASDEELTSKINGFGAIKNSDTKENS